MSTFDGDRQEEQPPAEDDPEALNPPSAEENLPGNDRASVSRARSVPARASVDFSKFYSPRDIDKVLGVFGQLQRSPLAQANIGRIVNDAFKVTAMVDPAVLLGMDEIAKVVNSSPLVATSLGSGGVSAAVAPLLNSPPWSESSAMARRFLADYRPQILDTAAQIEAVSLKFNDLFVSPEVQRCLKLASDAWAITARVMPDTPDVASTGRLLDAGRTTLGMSTTGLILTRTENDEWEDEYLLDGRGDELLMGPEDARRRLRAVLASLDPHLPDRLDGAWERVSHKGPDATSQAANSLVELIDWTLRLAAPDSDVLAWHAEERRPARELHKGRPTKALRVRYIVRERPDAEAAEMYAQGIPELRNLLEGRKHGTGEQQLAALARLVPTVEAYLCFLLL